MIMEKHECPSKQKKIKARISINIGALVLLGGALAVTSLIAAAAFAVKRRRLRDADKKDLPCKKEVKGSQGLSFTLQNPSSTSHPNPCLTDGCTGMVAEETQVDSIELVSTESLILGENSASMINDENENLACDDQEILLADDPKKEMMLTSCEYCCGVQEDNSASMINDENDYFTGDDQEILLTDDTKPEIIFTSIDDSCGMDELTLAVLDSESMDEVEDKVKNDSEENSSWLERIEIKRQEEEVDTERTMEEETISVYLVEEEDEEQDRVEGGEEEDEEEYTDEEYVLTEEEAVGAEKMTAETTVAMHWVEGEEEEEEDSSEEYAIPVETNTGVIRPAESILFLSPELKNTRINTQSSELKEKIVEEDGSTKTDVLRDSIEALPLEVKNTSENLQSLESKEKILEEDRRNKIKDFGYFNNGESNILNDDTDNHETRKNPISMKKKEMPKLVEVNNQTAVPTRRKIWVCSMLLLALSLLLVFIHRGALFYRVENGNSFFVRVD